MVAVLLVLVLNSLLKYSEHAVVCNIVLKLIDTKSARSYLYR